MRNDGTMVGGRKVAGDYIPWATVFVAILLIVVSTAEVGNISPIPLKPFLLMLGGIALFAGLLILAVRASWTVIITPTRVLIRKPFLKCLFFVLWPALLPIAWSCLDAMSREGFISAHRQLLAPLCYILVVVGCVGLFFIPNATPVQLDANPEKRRYTYKRGIPPFQYATKGALYDMLGVRVDEERDRYILRISWRAKRWKIDFASYSDRDVANTAGRRVAKAMGTSCWTAD